MVSFGQSSTDPEGTKPRLDQTLGDQDFSNQTASTSRFGNPHQKKKKKPGPCSSKANSSSSMSSNFHQPSCLDNCLATFGNIIVPGDRDFDKVCKILSAKSADSTFSWLYCCDLNHCGIGFGSSAGLDCKPYSTSPAAQHWLTAPQANVNEVINHVKGQES